MLIVWRRASRGLRRRLLVGCAPAECHEGTHAQLGRYPGCYQVAMIRREAIGWRPTVAIVSGSTGPGSRYRRTGMAPEHPGRGGTVHQAEERNSDAQSIHLSCLAR